MPFMFLRKADIPLSCVDRFSQLVLVLLQISIFLLLSSIHNFSALLGESEVDLKTVRFTWCISMLNIKLIIYVFLR